MATATTQADGVRTRARVFSTSNSPTRRLPSEEGLEAFEAEWRPRTVVRADIPSDFDSAEERASHNRPRDLEREVRLEAKRLAEYSQAWTSVFAIGVRDRDGMTWSARAAQRAAAQTLGSHWQVRRLRGSKATTPDAVQDFRELLGSEEAVVKAVKRSGLAPQAQIQWVWLIPTVLITFGLIFGGIILADKNTAAGIGIPIVGLAAIIAALKLADRLIGPVLKLPIGQEANIRALDALRGPMLDQAAEKAFEADVIAQLAHTSRLAVIVDRVERLHDRTRPVVKACALGAASDGGAVHLWVVFERDRTGEVAEALRRPLTDRETYTRCYRQRPLSRSEKKALLEHVTSAAIRSDDPRLSQVAIADVCDARRANFDQALSELEAALRTADKAVRRAFALLALASARTDPPQVSVEDLERLAVPEPAAGDTATALASALHEWFGTEPGLSAVIRGALQAVASDFRPFLEDESLDDDVLVVERLYADAFESQNWRKLGLPSRDFGHAIWALYSHHVLVQRPDASVADRLVAQLRAIGQPAEVAQVRQSMATALFDAAMAGAEAALAYSLPGASTAVEKANLSLIERPFRAKDRERGDRLLGVAWAVHFLTGDRAALSTVSSVANALAPAARESSNGDALVDLFLQTRPAVSKLDLTITTPGAEANPASDHARARAAWLAQVAEGVTGFADQFQPEWPLPIHAATRAWPNVPPLIDRVFERLELRTGSEWEQTLDLATLSIALWSLSAVLARAQTVPVVSSDWFVERAERASALFERLAGARTSTATHFPLEGALTQLLAVVGVCADQLAARSDDRRLSSLAERALNELDDRSKGEQAWRLRRHLSDLQAMWRTLEVDEMGELAALIEAHLAALHGELDDADALPDFLVGIGTSESGAIYAIQTMLLRSTTASSKVSAERSAILVTEAAKRAIDAGLGEPLVGELCVAGLMQASIYAVDMTRLAQWLLWLGAAPAARNETSFLRSLNDSALSEFTLLMLNAPPIGAEATLVDEIAAGMRRRAESAPAYQRHLIDQTINNDVLRRAVDGGGALPDCDETLDWWQTSLAAVREAGIPEANDAALAHYYFGLYQLWCLPGARESQRLRRESLAVLRTAQPMVNVMYIALRMANVLEGDSADAAARETALDFAGRNIQSVDHRLGINWNISAYAELATRDPDRARRRQHGTRLDYWRAEELLRGEEQLLLDLQAGRFFKVFWYYHRRLGPELRYYGDPAQVATAEQLSEIDRRAAIMRVDGPKKRPPEPLVSDGSVLALSVDFLALGFMLFNPPLSDDDRLDPLRSAFNAAARQQVSLLYRMLISLPNVSGRVRDVLQRHAHRFERAW